MTDPPIDRGDTLADGPGEGGFDANCLRELDCRLESMLGDLESLLGKASEKSWAKLQSEVEDYFDSVTHEGSRIGSEKNKLLGKGWKDTWKTSRRVSGYIRLLRQVKVKKLEDEQEKHLEEFFRQGVGFVVEGDTDESRRQIGDDLRRSLRRYLVSRGFSVSPSEVEWPEVDSPTTHKRRGRKNADCATVQREAQLAVDWEQARDSGVYKPDFAKDHEMTVRDLDRLLDRVAKRNARSDK